TSRAADVSQYGEQGKEIKGNGGLRMADVACVRHSIPLFGQDCFRNARMSGVPAFVLGQPMAAGEKTPVGMMPFLISIPNLLAVSRLRLNSPTSTFNRSMFLCRQVRKGSR